MNVAVLAKDAYGNYALRSATSTEEMSSNVQPPKCRVQVVQHMLEHGRKEDKKRILVCVKTSGSRLPL